MGAVLQHELGAVPEHFVQNRLMPAVGKVDGTIHRAGFHQLTVHHALDGGPIAPAELSDVGWISQNVLHGAGRPFTAGGGGDAPGIQPLGDRIGAERAEGTVREELTVDVPVVDLADDFGLLRDDAQGVPLFTGQLIAFIAVGGLAGDILSLGQRGPAAALEPSVDGLILPPGHKKAELKIFLVKFVARVIDLIWGDDFCIAVLEGVSHDALIGGVAAGQTFHLHDQDTGPAAGLHVIEKPLHFRALRDRFAAAYLLITPGDIESALSGELEQVGPVPGQRIPLAVGFGLQVYTGFTEIQTIFVHRAALTVLAGTPWTAR